MLYINSNSNNSKTNNNNNNNNNNIQMKIYTPSPNPQIHKQKVVECSQRSIGYRQINQMNQIVTHNVGVNGNRQISVGGVFWQYPYQFKNSNNHNVNLDNSGTVSKNSQNNSFLDRNSKITNSTILPLPLPLQSPSSINFIQNHKNPARNKLQSSLFRSNKPRPNSQDNKHDYINKQAGQKNQRKQRKAQSLHKYHNQYQEETTIYNQASCKQNTQNRQNMHKSPYKPHNFNQYQSNLSISSPSQKNSRLQIQNFSQILHSSPSSKATPTTNQQKFLSQCLSHIMIQNSCLTKQMVLKQLQLAKLRHQLQKLKQKHKKFEKTKVDIESFSNMQVIISASEEESQEIQEQRNVGIPKRTWKQDEMHIKQRSSQNSNWKKKKLQPKSNNIFDISQKIVESKSIHSHQNTNQNVTQHEQISYQNEENYQTSLKQIHSIISQIQNEEKKLDFMYNQKFRQTPKDCSSQIYSSSQNNQVLTQLSSKSQTNQKKQQAQQSTTFINSSRYKQKNQVAEQVHKVQGMQFTRLGKLRLKKGIISKRSTIQQNNKP